MYVPVSLLTLMPMPHVELALEQVYFVGKDRRPRDVAHGMAARTQGCRN